MINPALARCFEVCGSRSAFARLLGVSPAAICKWNDNGIPARRVPQVVNAMAETYGWRVSHHELRPDIFPFVPIHGIPRVSSDGRDVRTSDASSQFSEDKRRRLRKSA